MDNINNDAYADIDKLIANQNSMLDQQQNQQNNILDQQLQMQIDQMNRNKAEIDKNTNQTNSGLYAEYKKASNRYGANAENLYTQGLGNSGFAESTQTNLYNTYQKNITDTLNNAQKLKSDFDFAIQQARQNRDLQSAQFALELYKQKMNLASQEYDLRSNKEEQLYNRGIDERNYNYQVGRDAVADNQWLQQFNFNKDRANVADDQWNRQFEYQANRDNIADQQWNRQFDFNVGRAKVADDQWNRQFDYQQSRDTIADNQWEKEYQRMLQQAEAQERWNQMNFDYQQSRDSIADNQWEREFALAQKAKAGSSSSGGSSNKKQNNNVDLDDGTPKTTNSILKNIKTSFQDAIAQKILENGIINGNPNEAQQKALQFLMKHK